MPSAAAFVFGLMFSRCQSTAHLRTAGAMITPMMIVAKLIFSPNSEIKIHQIGFMTVMIAADRRHDSILSRRKTNIANAIDVNMMSNAAVQRKNPKDMT